MSKALYTRKGSGAFIDWIKVELNQIILLIGLTLYQIQMLLS